MEKIISKERIEEADSGNVFDLLEPRLKSLVLQRFKEPTPIQSRVIPAVLQGKNVLVISETGSGKTESALLPLFNNLIKNKHMPIEILYITPLRSLNRDLLKRILWWSEKLDFEVSVRHGDTSPYERKMQTENPPDMLIVTPETLQAVLTAKKMREHLANTKYIVIDEAHELVSNKRGLQLSVALERLKEVINNAKQFAGLDKNNQVSPAPPQIIGLSATVGSPEEVMKYLSPEEINEPHKSDLIKSDKVRKLTPLGEQKNVIINMGKVKELLIKVEYPLTKRKDSEVGYNLFVSPQVAARLRRINELIKEKKSVLTFTNTREFAEVLSSRLKAFDTEMPIDTHHSSLSKPVRIEAEEKFKNEQLKSLVCTSSLELGIDIGSIDFIIQYMSPRQVTKFLQRIGRSGHSLERTSEGSIIVTDIDDSFESTAIASLALKGFVEPTYVYEQSWDVLAHQIVGLALEEYKIPIERAYKIVKRAYPYRNLKKDEFFRLCEFLQRLHFIWLNEDNGDYYLKRKKLSYNYYFNNLTTIPDTKNYKIINMLTNTPVGSLDAEFVALNGNPGSTFICKGLPWKIIQITQDRIFVEPVSGIEGAIPAWTGELIPVPYQVAQAVGMIRSEIAGMLGHKKPNEIVSYLESKYPVTQNVARRMYKIIKQQADYGFVPDHENILAEYYAQEGEIWLILHTLWGSLVNDTIGRVVAASLLDKIGSVGLQTDPYRIIFRLQSWNYNDVLDALKNIRAEDIEKILKTDLQNTELFKYRFMHVAQRFGIVSRDADYGKAYVRKIIEVYASTPAFEEAINEVIREKLNIEKSRFVLGQIKSGKIKITLKPGLSPLGRLALAKKYEIIAPKTPQREIAKIFKERLLDTKIGLVCCNCGNVFSAASVRHVPERLVCKYCDARLIGFVPYRYIYEAEKLMKKHLRQPEYVNVPKSKKAKARLPPKPKFSDREKKYIEWIMNSAALIITNGHDAIKALAGRGIGPRTASRILAKGVSGEQLYELILEAERQYIRTRAFWKG